MNLPAGNNTLDGAGSEANGGNGDDGEARFAELEKLLQHPIRTRILGHLRNGGPYTQRELGRTLSLSNAVIHYHIKVLVKADLVELKDVRPGPNGIVEKLFGVNDAEWQALAEARESTTNPDLELYLQYALSWIQERNREGSELLKTANFSEPFVAGSHVAYATRREIIALKRQMQKLLGEFFAEHREPAEGASPYALTFSLFPSRPEGCENAENVLQYEPGDEDYS